MSYVGLPLAVEFGQKCSVVGFDISQPCINALKAGHNTTLEVSDEEFAESKGLSYITSLEELKDCNVYIITVPTSINEHKQPDLTPLIKASETIGKVYKKATSLFMNPRFTQVPSKTTAYLC